MRTLGIDLDGTIDEACSFFKILCNCWPGDVVIITFRKDRERAAADVAKYGIRHDEIILVNSLEEKAKVIEERGVAVYFDDQDECLQGIPENVTVFKIRNGGNFDFEDRKWLYSAKTGKEI